jgi:tRNA threonylcarbamoyladenosine biosynthesis protein TsaB
LVVARGPGSYTGVRVALSSAKGIAAALRVPVWGISSLDVLAFATPSDLPVRAILEAGRGRYATALYAQAAPIEAARLMTLEQLDSAIDRDTLIVGELRDEARAALAQNPRARLAPRAAAARRAGYLAELGWQCARRGDPGDPTTLDALYLG